MKKIGNDMGFGNIDFGKKIREAKDIGKTQLHSFKTKVKDDMKVIDANKKTYIGLVVIALVLMFLFCWTSFFIFVKGPEEVLVPNIEGKSLEEALCLLQERELYQKLVLKYTDDPEEKGMILEQDPKAGAIVKAGRRINLIASRGTVLESVEDYVGKNFEEEQIRLQALFAGEGRQIISFDVPIYKSDVAPQGQILSQDPAPGTKITSPVKVKVVVSKGAAYENTKAPDIVGKNINDMLSFMSSCPLIFDFSAHIATQEEEAGTVTSVQTFATEYIPNYTRVQADFALPSTKTQDNMVYAIFSAVVAEYPYPVEMSFVAKTGDAGDMNENTIVKMRHKGGLVTIPYCLPEGTTLELRVKDKTIAKAVAN